MSEVIKPKIGAYRRHLLVCTGSRCTEQGESEELFLSLKEKFAAAGINKGELRVKRTRTSCFAACKGGPILCVQPDGTWYYNVTPANLDRIIAQHLVGGQPVQELVFHQSLTTATQREEQRENTTACSPPAAEAVKL